jgi:DNA mismatch repair protein MutS2
VDTHHFELDKLLNRTEQDLQLVQQERKELHKKLKENDVLKDALQQMLDKEKHHQQISLLKEQNRVAEDKFAYNKDMERQLKQIALDWKKTEKKEEVMKNLYNLLFKKNDAIVINKLAKKVDKNFKETNAPIIVGATVKLKKNYQVGEVLEIKGKRAIVKVGQLPMNIDLVDLLVVEKIPEEAVNQVIKKITPGPIAPRNTTAQPVQKANSNLKNKK